MRPRGRRERLFSLALLLVCLVITGAWLWLGRSVYHMAWDDGALWCGATFTCLGYLAGYLMTICDNLI